jgi:hypothetical protein
MFASNIETQALPCYERLPSMNLAPLQAAGFVAI